MADKKIRYGGTSAIEKMEEAAGITSSPPSQVPPTPAPPETFEMPYGKGEIIKSGEVARPWTGPKPWRDKRDKSAAGSKAFSDAELKQGYRKVK